MYVATNCIPRVLYNTKFVKHIMEYCFSLADTFLRESTRRVAFKWQILVMLDIKVNANIHFC